MVGRKRDKRQKPLMGSHNRCWLWGRHVVLETLTADRWPVVELLLSSELPEDERRSVETLAGEREVSLEFAPPDRLRQLCGASDHQGYLAKMRPFPYQTTDEFFGNLATNAVVCLLDGVQDPHNYGAILRSVEVLGIDGVIVGTSRQSEVTSIVARSSAGAVNHVALARTDSLVSAAQQLRDECEFTLVAADHRAEHAVDQHDWTIPTGIIIGNEASGVSEDLRALCAGCVHIPQFGRIESLNAAVAAGILFYEVRRQRGSTSKK